MPPGQIRVSDTSVRVKGQEPAIVDKGAPRKPTTPYQASPELESVALDSIGGIFINIHPLRLLVVHESTHRLIVA